MTSAYRRPDAWIVATAAIGATASTTALTRARSPTSVRKATTAANTSIGGPRLTGHARNVAMPLRANRFAAKADGRSSHSTTASHIVTAKSSETTWARNDASAKEPRK